MFQPRVAIPVVVVCDVAEVETQVRKVLAFLWERRSCYGGWVVGDLAHLRHAFQDADLGVGLPPEEVGHSHGEGGGVSAEFGACLEVCDESVCSLEDRQDSASAFFKGLSMEVHLAVEEGFGERLEAVTQGNYPR